MKRILFFLLVFITVQLANAQSVGIGTTNPNASAQLDVTSTTKGMLIPRMTGAQRTAIPSPEPGLLVIQTNSEVVPPSSPGLYLFELSGLPPGAWKRIARADEISSGTSTWTVNGSNQYSNVAGNVGIGTSSPSASALLDVNSTSKGILVPRMTTAQRTAIVSPASGLFVYDITSNGFWYYNGSAWVQISTGSGSDWLNNANDIYNANTGNVGIGTSSPTSKFHLIGNLLQENGNLTINNTIPTLQFQNSGVNKGFLQTTGGDNNILIGTSSGNTAGRFIVRLNGISSLVVEPNGNVGIGTATPDASAKLDISSTTGGLLIPRMTLAQRISIASPATGLMAYDTDTDEFWYYDGAAWQRLLNSNYDYWNKSSSRHWVYNISDSIGLGTSSPTEKLEVNGNIRSRDNILADGYITATGAVQGGSLASLGNLLVLGTGVVSGDLQTNSDFIINNTSAILQLKSSNVNKGFYQLVGDNVRFGTNSGNTGGDVILRMDGDDMISFEKSAGGAFMRMYRNGVSTGVLQTTSAGNVSLTNPIANGRVDLGGEIFINNTTNRTGIGTSSPSERLHVQGNTYISGSINVGDADIYGDAYVAGHLTIGGQIDGNVQLDDTLFAGTVNSDRVSANGGAFGTNASSGSIGLLAVGYDVLTNGDGACIIADNTSNFLNNSIANRMVMRFNNGYRFYTSAAALNAESCELPAGGNAWVTASDFRLKEKIVPANGEDFLKKISIMKLGSWNYISQNPLKQRHYGPMAQDFYAAFGKDKFGTIGNDTTINSADFDGVNMIAIQALEKRTTIQQQDISTLKKEIEDLKAILLQQKKLLVELSGIKNERL